jgi:ABC-type transporter Mla subunit MlaD
MIFIFGALPVKVAEMRSFEVLVNFPTAPGVQRNTPVQYCGYQIGKVTAVSPPFAYKGEAGKTYHQVKVSLAIENKYTDIPSNVDVVIIKRSMGSSYIELQFDPDKPLDLEQIGTAFLTDEFVMDGTMSSASEFFPKEVQQKIERLVSSISTLSDNLNDIIGDDENKVNIKAMLANVATATAQAQKTLVSIEKFSNKGAAAVEDVSEQLNGVLVEIKEVAYKINNGDGTVSRMINDGQLYEDLLDSSEELKLALEQLKIMATEMNEKGIKIKL